MLLKWSPNGTLEDIKKCLRRNLGEKSAELYETSLFTMFRKDSQFTEAMIFQ